VDQPVRAASGSERLDRLAELLRRAQNGEVDALDEIVSQLNPLLWHLARSTGATPQDAEDVVQTAWLELVRHLADIRSPAALTGWLMQVTRREAWRHNARRRRAGPTTDTLEDVAGEPVDPLLGLENEVLWRHFATLSERCRQLLRVVAHGGKADYAAIAAALDMPVGSIGPTRGRCLAKLRQLLLADPAWTTG
jgi:RNA polymerase sigma factor (sigma-70 family)